MKPTCQIHVYLCLSISVYLSSVFFWCYFHWWFLRFRLINFFWGFLWSKYRLIRNTQTTNSNPQLVFSWTPEPDTSNYVEIAVSIGSWTNSLHRKWLEITKDLRTIYSDQTAGVGHLQWWWKSRRGKSPNFFILNSRFRKLGTQFAQKHPS